MVVEQESSRAISRPTRAWLSVLIGTAVLGAVVNVLAFTDYVFEDAYITYGYAQNVAAGEGLVFNVGERLLGTTTPLYALLLGLLAILGADIPLASGILFAAGLAAVGVIGGLVLARLGAGWAGLLFNLAMALGVGNWTWQWGMETAFYTALLFAAWYAALLRKPTLAGIAMGLAFVTRYDAALFAIILLVVLWARDRRLPMRAGLVALAVVLPWLAFAQAYYGSVMPNTLGAKHRKTEVTEYMLGSLERQAENLLSPIMTLVPPRLHPDWLPIGLGVLVLALAAWGVLATVRRQPLVAVPALFAISLWLGYSIIGPGLGHSWHLLPAVPFVLTLAFLGASRSLRRVTREGTGRRLALAVGIAVYVTGFVAAGPLAFMRASELVGRSFYIGRIGSYADIAQWINARGLGDLTVMMQEPGYLHFLTGNPMIDTAGLVTRRLTNPVTGKPSGDINRLVRTFEPDIIIAPQRYWPRLDFTDFMPLMYARPLRTVYIRRATYAERFDAIADAWHSPDPGPNSGPDPDPAPRDVDAPSTAFMGIVGDQVTGWTTTGRLWGGYVKKKTPHAPGPLALEPPILSTWGRQWGGLVSPPFVIDFDELRFRLAATSKVSTEVRLLIDGHAVLVERGEDRELPTVREMRWSLSPWRGRLASLQLVDIDPGEAFVAVSSIESCRHARMATFDDFESGAYDSRWPSTFARRPRSNRRLAKQQAVHFELGAFGASSYGVGGRRALVSAPFTIDRDHLSFFVFDFGGQTRVELTVDGEAVRTWHGAQSGSLRSVAWDLSPWVGQEAVLAAYDDDARPSRWFGIDEIRVFDSGC